MMLFCIFFLVENDGKYKTKIKLGIYRVHQGSHFVQRND